MSKGPNQPNPGGPRGAGPEADARARAWGKTCGRCRTAFDAHGWRRLKEVGTLDRATIQAHLVVPAPDRIELRACGKCGAVIAATPPASE